MSMNKKFIRPTLKKKLQEFLHVEETGKNVNFQSQGRIKSNFAYGKCKKIVDVFSFNFF